MAIRQAGLPDSADTFFEEIRDETEWFTPALRCFVLYPL